MLRPGAFGNLDWTSFQALQLVSQAGEYLLPVLLGFPGKSLVPRESYVAGTDDLPASRVLLQDFAIMIVIPDAMRGDNLAVRDA